ncbi:DUF4097 family beta strand repeat-containing protein [Natronorubrum sp. FCH18a]|uniref:DUF4097 family beta strand repeat-containing protein n=1 Tax=Natronorubrum sp. FCH18a TaxID=3447018 RepID=UPI003F5192C2
MTRLASRRSVLVGAAGGALCGVAGCLSSSRDVEETVTKTHATDELRAVTVSTTVSDVDVHATPTDAVDIEGQKAAVSRDDLESVGLSTATDGGILDVSVDRDDSHTVFGIRPDPVLDLSVAVPDRLEVRRIESQAGDIGVENVQGGLQLRTETGSVDATAVDGTVTAATETGAVVVDDPESIDRLVTDTGDVTASLPGLDGDAAIETSTGSVDLRVPDDLDLTLEITTETGEITVTDVEDLPEMAGDSLIEAVVGDGANRLEVSTETGDVTVTGLEGE